MRVVRRQKQAPTLNIATILSSSGGQHQATPPGHVHNTRVSGFLFQTLLFVSRLQAPQRLRNSLLQCLPELRDGVTLGEAEERDASALRVCRADKVLAWDFGAGEGDGLCGATRVLSPHNLTLLTRPPRTPSYYEQASNVLCR